MKSELSEVEFEDFPSICRICLHRGDVKPFIQTLQDLFSSLVKEITEDDELPKNLCDKCCEKLEEIQEFITNSVISDEYLRDVLWKHKNGFNVESFEDDTKFEITTDSTPDVENDMHLLKDEYSDNEITEENEYAEGTEDESIISDDKELEEIDEIDNYEFHCKVCKNIFISSEDLEDHEKNNSECLEEKKKNDYKCNICNKIISSRAGLKRHAVCHTNETPYECPHCDRKFKFQHSLKRHDKIVHKGLRPFKCDICGKEFARKEYLEKHIKSCGRVKNKSECYQHMFGQNAASETECHICEKLFCGTTGLKRHLLVHSGMKEFLCKICGKSFATKFLLNLHEGTHTNDRKFQCELCGKRPTHFNRHMLVHSGEKPHNCNICNKSFKLSSHLTRHISMHMGEKPYKCTFCNKNFGEKSNLKIHMRLHTGEKPYNCSFCDKSFCDSSSRKKHERKHTKD